MPREEINRSSRIAISILKILLAVGLFRIAGSIWLGPLLENREFRRWLDSIPHDWEPLENHVFCFFSGGWMHGLPLVYFSSLGLALLWRVRGNIIHGHSKAGLAGIALGLAAQMLTIFISLPFFSVPAGEHIRPMAWSAFVIILAGVTLVSVLPLAIISWVDKSRGLAATTLFLGLSPLPCAILMLRLAMYCIGFELSD